MTRRLDVVITQALLLLHRALMLVLLREKRALRPKFVLLAQVKRLLKAFVEAVNERVLVEVIDCLLVHIHAPLGLQVLNGLNWMRMAWRWRFEFFHQN